LRDQSDSGFAVGSGGDHCDRELAVEVRGRRRRRRRRRRADIKSNNPHLTGGEKTKAQHKAQASNVNICMYMYIYIWYCKPRVV
jgi:hypothetical protein